MTRVTPAPTKGVGVSLFARYQGPTMFANDRPLLGVYWGDRAESLEESAARAHGILDALAGEGSGPWRLRADDTPLDEAGAIAAAMRAHVEAAELDESYGFVLEAQSEQGWVIDLTVGAKLDLPTAPTPNSVVLERKTVDLASERTLLRSLVERTDPEWGVSTRFARVMELALAGSPGAPHVGALTFFSARRGNLPPLPAGIELESWTEGHLLTVVGAPFEETRDRAHDFLAQRGRLRPILVRSDHAPATERRGSDPAHAIATSFLHHALRAADVGLVIGPGAPHGPADLALYLEGASPLEAVPHLVIEVVGADPAVAREDRGARIEAHERAGVPYVWLLDPRLGLLEVLERGADGRYVRAATASESGSFVGLATVTLELDALFAEIDRWAR